VTAPVTEIPRRARRTKRRLPWWLWTLIGAGSIVGIVALLGGFNEVPIEKLPQVQLGERFVGNEVALAVDDIYLSLTAPVTGYDLDEGEVYLVVEATAENTTASPNVFLNRSLRVLVEGAVGSTDAPYNVVDLRTGDGVSFLQPGLPTEVAFLWKVDERRIEPGQEIFLGIFERYDKPDDPRFDDSKTAPVAIVRLAESIGEYR
jgi:hypothetical protein